MRVSQTLKFFRPFSITSGFLILFAIWSWIDMSGISYRPGSFAGGRTTAGWFILGFPALLGIGLIFSLPCSLIARRAGSVAGWICLFLVFVPLIVYACARTTPLSRLRSALESDPPVGTRILRLEQYDSFSDGYTIAGICSVNPQFYQLLISERSLTATDSDYLLKLKIMLPEEPIPEEGNVFANNDLTIWYDTDRSLLYFYRSMDQRRQQ